jgi:hypothetical protein
MSGEMGCRPGAPRPDDIPGIVVPGIVMPGIDGIG